MKIEFELEMQEAALMMDILRKAAFESNNQKVRTVIGKIINEIESDSKVAHFILGGIRHLFTTNNLTKNKIFPQSDMEYGLGIPKPFLQEPRGLTKMANFILMQTVKKFKPSISPSKVKKIGNAAIKKCVLVHDVMVLIQTAYEGAK
ncbi:hypothetical protein [Flagellimonas sp.]|uniref:hypothetical protein n=1 Tax=Flagellimonas sp. TaxID=2058762 RepID=UPI003F4A26AA